jgi:hypothetical protein
LIIYLKHNEIDREKWDKCIENTPGSKPYSYSWYLDLLAPGWEALVDDEYDSVFPVPGSVRFGIRYIATPVFLQQLGAFSPDKDATESLTEFLDYLPDFFRFIDLCVGQEITYPGFRVDNKINFELDLSASYETLSGNFTDHCRRNVEISRRNRPELVSDIRADELTGLFRSNRGINIKGIKVSDYMRLMRLMNFCTANRKGRMIGVRDAGKKLIFGVFVVTIRGRVTILFVVNTPESRERRIGYFVVNKLIEEFASTRTILDFAGSSVPSVAAFYSSFGSKEIPYYRLYRNRLIWPLRLIK